VPTPHIEAEEGDFAPDVLMPGDPRRAKLIAETFFDSPRLVNEVRGILGYTGTFNGKPVSVLASGMGSPSIGIYSTELARFYGVKRIIRVGTIGGIAPYLELGDVIAASAAHTNSAMSKGWIPGVTMSHAPSFPLLRKVAEHGEQTGKTIHIGPLFTTDSFYNPDTELVANLLKYGTIGIEMEAAALYATALKEHFEALMIGTVSDLPGTVTTAAEREATFADMVSFALAAFQ
jgi:purine-nucleoside phosphorylase